MCINTFFVAWLLYSFTQSLHLLAVKEISIRWEVLGLEKQRFTFISNAQTCALRRKQCDGTKQHLSAMGRCITISCDNATKAHFRRNHYIMAVVQRNKERESLLSAFRWSLRDGKCEHVGLPSLVRLSAWQIAQGVIVTLMGNARRQRGALNVSRLPDITQADPKHGPDGQTKQ